MGYIFIVPTTSLGCNVILKHVSVQYSPLRYPGGKGRLAGFFKEVIRLNDLCGAHYVEPYAGGAGVAFSLLMTEYSGHIHLNDISYPLYCFWRSVIDYTEDLCRKINDTHVTPEEWEKQKKLLLSPLENDIVSIGFAFFFLNRTNRSGVIDGGIIGGKSQQGQWKIDARFNKKELVRRIACIADYNHRIHLYNLDAEYFLSSVVSALPQNTLVYLDPPYYEKGQRLYQNCYNEKDHETIASLLQSQICHPWVVSYDDCDKIHKLYRERKGFTYTLHYSAAERRIGKEVMFFSDNLNIPTSLSN